MKIKKQFFLLGLSIISIPLLCFCYFFFENYKKSQDRVLLQGYKEIRKLDGTIFPKSEWNELNSIISKIPDKVDCCVISEDSIVVISTIDEIQENTLFTKSNLWKLIETSSKEFFYQYTTIPINNHDYVMITRVLRKHQFNLIKKPFLIPLIGILTVLGFILITYIVLIFLSISKSITTLTNKTKELAEGNLDEKIVTSGITATNEITSITESLEKMRLSLVEAQNQKNKFIMGMSHDLRTPVAIIKGYTEALNDGIISSPEEVKNTLDLISIKTNQLEDMINTLINYVKLNTTEIRNKLEQNSITTFISDFVKDSIVSGQVFTREIITNVSFDKNIQVPFDKQLANRAFENLFSNAVRYTKENDKIILEAFNDDTNVYFSISDTGLGIDEQDLNNIFNLFYRGTNSRREEGMGIGLSVVKNIMETHQWEIKVESEKNSGTKFTVIIPYNFVKTESNLQIKQLFKKGI